jgi:hypothetical protein
MSRLFTTDRRLAKDQWFRYPNIHREYDSKVAQLEYFEVSTMTPVTSKLHTLRYRTVIRDQRCPWDQVDFIACPLDMRTQLTQIKSAYKTILSEMTAPVIASAYLLSECKR